jgi:hypothetical protein
MIRSFLVPVALMLLATPQSSRAQAGAGTPDSVTKALGAIGLTESGLELNGRYARGNTTIVAGDTVRGPLVVVGGTADVYGVIAGDVHSLWGDVVVHEGADVLGAASAYRGRVILDGGRIRGSMESWQRATGGAVAAVAAPVTRGRALTLSVGWTAMFVIIGIIVLVLLASNIEATARVLEKDFGRAFFVGVLGQLGFLPLLLLTCVALAVTIVGILLIPFALVAAPVALAGFVTLGWLALALVTGRALSGAHRDGASRNEALRALTLGVVLLMAPWIVAAALHGTGMAALVARVVALTIAWVALSAGLGASLLSRAGAARRKNADRPQPPMQGWQTPTPITGVAAARRPIPARPGATPQ